MQYCDSRQEVTGLVINKKVNVKSDYRHGVRAMVHRLLNKGEYFHETVKIEGGAEIKERTIGTLDQLHGMLGFVDGIDLLNRRKSKLAKDGKLSTKELMYKRFLLYKEFYASPMPVLVCEGKTDNVYIAHAIISLATKYPVLTKKNEDGSLGIAIKRFRHSGNTSRILGIQGGSADIARFIQLYNTERKKFRAPESNKPVILLIDNDDGASNVYSVVNQVTKVKHASTERFIHLFGNLYLVPTPLAGKKSSCIEDFFDVATRSTVLHGRTLSTSNNLDSSVHYGKADFAYKVIAPNAKSIDFSGFSELLSTFVDIIVDCAARKLVAV
jgi:hypothetical protein